MIKLTNVIKSGLALGAIAVAAGCSGGGSSPSAPHPVGTTASGTSLPSSFGKSNTAVTLSLHSRANAKRAVAGGRKRNYISAATQGLIASFTDSSNTTTQGFALTPGATATAASPAACSQADPSTGSYTCTLYFSLTSGSYTATLTAYDAPQSGTTGTPVAATGAASAVALSTDSESITVTANQANNFSFTLHGIVEAFDADPQYIGVAASPSPSSSPLSTTFHALDGDFYLIDAVDATTDFAYGAQPSGPFASPAPFAVSASDQNTCAATPCVSLASPSPTIVDPTTEGIAFSYAGGGTSGDGSAANPPYFGLIGVTGPSGYAGHTSATIGSTAYAATAYVMPFFAIVDQSTKNAAATDASDVSFTTPSDSVNVLAVQYHLPTNSTGYTIDTSACGSIASASAGTPLASGYGESFTLTPGTQSGQCVVTLSDGVGDTGTINVTSTAAGASTVTVPCASPTLAPDVQRRSSAARDGIRQVASSNPCLNGLIYVANIGNATITGYPVGSTGDTAPTFVLGGNQTQLRAPIGVNFDSAGDMYVSDFDAGAVFKYGPGASGNAAPILTLTGLSNPYDVAFDKAGNIYVANGDGGDVKVFAPNATTPSGSIGDNYIQRASGVAVDAKGYVYVGDQAGATLDIFAPGATAPISGSAGEDGEQIALAPNGTIYQGVYNPDTASNIAQYSATLPGGPVTVESTITGAEFSSPTGVAFGSDGTLFISDLTNGALFSFAPNASGNAAPLTTISGADTALSSPFGIDIHSGPSVASAQTTAALRMLRTVLPHRLVRPGRFGNPLHL